MSSSLPYPSSTSGIQSAYGIDILKRISELKTLSEPVDEATLCPHAFSDDDMVDVQTIVNESRMKTTTGLPILCNLSALPITNSAKTTAPIISAY